MTDRRKEQQTLRPGEADDNPEAEPEDEGTNDENDRPTLAPPFDVATFARKVSVPSMAPPQVPPGAAPPGATPLPPTARVATLTNEVEQERVRNSMMSVPDSLGGGDASPDSLLSIVNSQIPSLPPVSRAPATTRSLTAKDSVLSEPPSSGIAPLEEMADRFALGDYSGALSVAEKLLEQNPEHAQAAACADNCRSVLKQMYLARIGSLDRVPIVSVGREQLRWLSIDHRAGFVLSHIDGISSVEMILDVSGMPVFDALRILHELVQQRIIVFE